MLHLKKKQICGNNWPQRALCGPMNSPPLLKRRSTSTDDAGTFSILKSKDSSRLQSRPRSRLFTGDIDLKITTLGVGACSIHHASFCLVAHVCVVRCRQAAMAEVCGLSAYYWWQHTPTASLSETTHRKSWRQSFSSRSDTSSASMLTSIPRRLQLTRSRRCRRK